MRRTPGAPASRLCAVSLAFGMVVTVPNLGPSLALAQPASSDTLTELVTEVATVNQKLQNLGAAIQSQQESVNKAILDVKTARDTAAAKQRSDHDRREIINWSICTAFAQIDYGCYRGCITMIIHDPKFPNFAFCCTFGKNNRCI